jgi:hypothetical protein
VSGRVTNIVTIIMSLGRDTLESLAFCKVRLGTRDAFLYGVRALRKPIQPARTGLLVSRYLPSMGISRTVL